MGDRSRFAVFAAALALLLGGAMTPRAKALVQVHESAPRWVDEYLSKRGVSWDGLERGDLGVTPQKLLYWLICSDPVRWAECNLINRPEDGGGPWRLFDYQKESARLLEYDVIHADAAGVGKTREIVMLAMWAQINKGANSLIAANGDGTLDQIWREMEWCRDANPWIKQQLPSAGWKLKPYRTITSASGAYCLFRPTGHDGEPFRAIHVSGFIFGDEAAKWISEEIYNELWRAAEPGCRVRLYSVPTGRKDTGFERIRATATPAREVIDKKSAGGTSKLTPGRTWVRFRWQKPGMPHPYWSEDRKDQFVRQYGGEHTTGYQRNVLGLPGDPEQAVFPLALLRRCMRPNLDFHTVKASFDQDTGSIGVEVYQATPAQAAGVDGEGLVVESMATRLRTTAASVEELVRIIRTVAPPAGVDTVVGVDVGLTRDPTEILVFEVDGERRRLLLRVQLRSAKVRQQYEVIQSLRATRGVGIDATGQGTALEGLFERDCSAYVWNVSVAHRDARSGDPTEDETDGKPRKVSAKEMATQVIEALVDDAALEMHPDPDMVTEWTSHSSYVGPNGQRLFDKDGDHTVDAARAALFRIFELENGRARYPSLAGVAIDETPAGRGLDW